MLETLVEKSRDVNCNFANLGNQIDKLVEEHNLERWVKITHSQQTYLPWDRCLSPIIQYSCWKQLLNELQQNMGRKAVASIALMWLIPVSILVNRIVPDPYMVKLKNSFLTNNFEFIFTIVWSRFLTGSKIAGWDIPRSSGTRVLQRQFQKLGSHDHYSSWLVSHCLRQ